MAHVRSTVLTLTVFSLAVAGLLADEKPDALEPLQVLEDCIEAAAAGDFATYVDHLSQDEQDLQAGYILLTSRSVSRAMDLGLPVADPEMLLLARTMRDLVARHTVPASERDAAYQAAENRLADLAGEPPKTSPSVPVVQTPSYPNPYPPATNYAPATPRGNPPYAIPVGREHWTRLVGVLKNPRDFLVAALAEIARPTDVTGEQVEKSNGLVNVGELAKSAQGLKWTMYTRGDYAIAVAKTPRSTLPAQPDSPVGASDRYAARAAAGDSDADPPYQVQFQRIDGRWKITRLLPVSAISGGNLLAAGQGNRAG